MSDVMSEPKSVSYTRPTGNPEKGLTALERKVRRELVACERPVTEAAIEIARLRAELRACLADVVNMRR